MVSMKTLTSHDEWLASRKRIGGSDAASALGMNPWRSNVELWRIKTGRQKQEDISEEDFVKYGTEAEKYLRSLFALDFPQYKVEYIENNLWLNDKYPFAHASLDGWLYDEQDRKGIFEQKTTNITSPIQKQKWENRIPDNYYCQVLHYLMVTEFSFAVLKVQMKYQYTQDDVVTICKHYHIERSEVEDDIKALEQAERKFWGYVVDDKEPPLLLPDI